MVAVVRDWDEIDLRVGQLGTDACLDLVRHGFGSSGLGKVNDRKFHQSAPAFLVVIF